MCWRRKEKLKDESTRYKWHFWLFIVIVILSILLLPFFYPVIAKAFVKVGVFKDKQEIAEYIEMFKNFYFVIEIGLVAIVTIYFVHNREVVKKLFSSLKQVTVKKGENEIIAQFETQNNDKEATENVVQSKKKAQAELKNLKENEDQIKLSEITETEPIKEIKEERDNYKIFSMYKATNTCCRNLLKKISIDDKMKVEEFREEMETYYKMSIKNMYGRKKESYIINKVNALLGDLRYLDIIEYSEDGDYIILTKIGKDFVNNYSKGVE